MDANYQPEPHTQAVAAAEESLVGPAMTGLGAALLGGIIWTVLMAVTGYEFGIIAWAIGGFVGFAMSRVTSRRDQSIALVGAGMAVAGLLIGRVLIAVFVLQGSGTAEVMNDPELMVQAVAIDMQFSGTLPEGIRAEYEALAEDDTVSDALWERTLAVAAERNAELTDEDRAMIADQYVALFLSQAGMTTLVSSQLSVYDLLWLFLAVTTAWRLLSPKEEAVVELAEESPPQPGDPTGPYVP